MSIIVDKVLSSFNLLNKIAEYCNGKDISYACCVNSQFNKVFSHDELWQQLCNRYGFKSLTSITKTRGKRSYKSIYLSSLCIECRKVSLKGNVIIDTNGGNTTRMNRIDKPNYSLISICIDCFNFIQQYHNYNDRCKYSLQNSKKRLDFFVWSSVLNKIPYINSNKNDKKRINSSSDSTTHHTTTSSSNSKNDYDNPNHNNYLIKKLKK